MHSCIYEGWVQHRRLGPREHEFRYRQALLYLDLAELDDVFRRRWFWSTRRPAIARFRREDYYGDPDYPLHEAIRALVEERTGQRPLGPIRLLTNPRYFGWAMNPVSFYYCFDRHDQQLSQVVAEVTNTPWGESHCYVIEHDLFADAQGPCRSEKELHVSPFLPMDMQYRWSLSVPDHSLSVGIENWRGDECCFRAQLQLARRKITRGSLASTLIRHPLITQRVLAAIYWEALRLWWKGFQFFPHPSKTEARTKELATNASTSTSDLQSTRK